MMPTGLFKLAASGMLALAIAGCSSGGAPDVGGSAGAGAGSGAGGAAGDDADRAPARPVDRIGRMQMENDFLGLRDEMRELSWSRNDLVPNRGSSTYNGFVGFSNAGEYHFEDYSGVSPEVVGNMAMTVYFASGDVTGSMWSFQDSEGNQAGGSIQLTGEQGHHGPGPSGASGEGASYVDATVDASGIGTLDWGDREQELDVRMVGNMVGDNAGFEANLYIRSTEGGIETSMSGEAMLENDSPPVRVSP